jgi:hypothetical protein
LCNKAGFYAFGRVPAFIAVKYWYRPKIIFLIMEITMKTFFLTAFTILSTTAAFAGDAVVAPVEAIPDSGSGDGALILLALLGIVIASSALGGVATRGATDMDIDPADINDEIGH